MKKIFLSFFVAIFSLAVSFLAIFPSPVAFAQGSCVNFNAATYTVPSGVSQFLINTQIATSLALHAKSGGSAGEENVQILIVMDRSGSMRFKDDSQQTKIVAAREAMTALVGVVEDAGNSNNQVGLVTFAGDATTNLPFTNDYLSAEIAVSQVQPTPGNGTAIGNGLYEAGKILPPLPPAHTKRFIILASDGVQTTGKSITEGKATIPSDVTVYTIGIGAFGYLNGPALTDIAQTAGAGDGEYLRSTVPELVNVFESLTKRIIRTFTLKDISLAFTRDDTSHTELMGTIPLKDAYDSTNGIMRWNHLGNFLSGQTKNIEINYKGTVLGRNIPLNTSSLTVGYTNSDGVRCNENVPVNVLSIEIGDKVPPPPACSNDIWSPSPLSVCRGKHFKQTNECQTSRPAVGTKLCSQCSDGIDNDGDGFIDYPKDRGCDSLEDDNEKNPIFHFFEF